VYYTGFEVFQALESAVSAALAIGRDDVAIMIGNFTDGEIKHMLIGCDSECPIDCYWRTQEVADDQAV